ncbi:MAG TPA: tetratricopeptide repeat protein [Rhizomicrobium sp.]|nr:tetratricopeptide repeat protein [Rhizomicrobium sp.]
MNRPLTAPGRQGPIQLSDESDFAVGNLLVSPSLREVSWKGQKEQLEPRIMQVLVALVNAAGAVVSRDELIRRCWDGRIVGEAAINRCIARLREVAEAAERSFRIETIPRVGYRLLSARPAVRVDRGILPSPSAQAAIGDLKRSRRGRVFLLAAIAAAAILGSTIAAYEIRLRSEPQRIASTPSADQASIAVLPFRNLSSDKDAGYFAAGIQDEILTRLAKIGSLKVISRTSTDQFASSTADIPTIARKLGVANVLEGNVQKSGGNIRVNVQLIRAANDHHIWAEDYDRKMDSVFWVESDIAGTIATVLAAKVSPGERKEIAQKPTTNPRAYDLYLHALVFAHKNDGTSLHTAVQLLEQAVQADPKFALAWARLARMQAYTHFGDNLAAVRSGEAHAALARALSLQPGLAETQAAKGFYLYYGEMNYPAAQRELQQVHAKWPNNVDALEALALVERRLGRWNESSDNLIKLISLDPLVPAHRINLATNLELQHHLERALSVLDDALKVWPDHSWLLSAKAQTYQQMGRLDLAEAALKNVHPAPDDSNVYFVVMEQYWLRRQYEQGAGYFRGLLALSQGQENPDSDLVTLRVVIGELLRMKGDGPAARANYTWALENLLSQLRTQPGNVDLLEPLADVYAGLGDYRMALRCADRTIEMLRSMKDEFAGAFAADNRALIMARFANPGTAINELAVRLKLPGQITPAILRLDPDLDRLRGDPRFETLVRRPTGN